MATAVTSGLSAEEQAILGKYDQPEPTPPTDSGLSPEEQAILGKYETSPEPTAAPQDTRPDYVKAALLGAEEAVSPFTVDLKQLKDAEKYGKGETASRVLASVLADIGSTVAAGAGSGAVTGAIAGTMVGPGPATAIGAAGGLIGGGLYSLYKAVGTEEISHKLTGDERSLARIALNAATDMNPLLKYGKAATAGVKAAKGATQAALQYAQAKSYGAEDWVAGLAGAVGGGAAGLTHQAKVRDGLIGLVAAPAAKPRVRGGDPEMTEEVMSSVTNQLRKDFDPNVQDNLWDKTSKRIRDVEQETDAFESMLNFDESVDSIEAMANKLGAAKVRELSDKIRPERLRLRDEREFGDALDKATEIEQKVASGQIKGGFEEAIAKSDEFGTLNEQPKWVADDLKGVDLRDIPEGMSKKDFTTLSLLDREYRDFALFAVDPTLERARHMSAKEVMEKFHEFKSRIAENPVGKKYLSDRYKAYRTQRAALEVIEEENAGVLKDIVKDPLKGKTLRFALDQMYAARLIDRVSGNTNIEVLTNAYHNQQQKHQLFFHGVQKKQKELVKLRKKAGIESEEMFTLLTDRSYRKEKWDSLKPIQREAVIEWRREFNMVRRFAVKNGIRVGHLADYAPQATKTMPEVISETRREWGRILKKNGIADPKKVTDGEIAKVLARRTATEGDKGSKSVAELLRVLETNTGAEIKTPKQLRTALEGIKDPQNAKKAIGYEARAAFERSGDMPDFIKEKNIDRLMLLYGYNTGKAAFLDRPIQDLAQQVPVLNALGMTGSRDYVADLTKALSGGMDDGFSTMTQAATTKWKVRMDEIMDDADSKLVKAGAKWAKDAPDVMSFLMSQVYPNYLGWAPHGPIRNASQPFLMTAPEIGGAYGQKVTAKSWLQSWGDKTTKGVNFEKFLQSKGLAGAQFTGESYRVMNDALNNVPEIARMGVKAVDEIGQLGMYIYSKSDMLNRYATYKIADNITKDYVKGVDGARKFMTEKLPAGVRNTMKRMLDEGADSEAITDELAKYLISKTQFNYGRHALGEYGRTLGPLVSMFSKWPVMMLSEMHEMYTTGKKFEHFQKYIAPYAALAGAGALFADTKENPRLRVLLGYGGLANWAPGSSILGAANMTSPPALEALKQLGAIGQDVAIKDYYKIPQRISKATLPFVPGYGIARMLDKIEVLKTGKDSD